MPSQPGTRAWGGQRLRDNKLSELSSDQHRCLRCPASQLGIIAWLARHRRRLLTYTHMWPTQENHALSRTALEERARHAIYSGARHHASLRRTIGVQ
eukprot:scaffold300900_cov26-Tisochrysis_lutea.AAC.1